MTEENERKLALMWLDEKIGDKRALDVPHLVAIRKMLARPVLPALADEDAVNNLAHVLWMGNLGRHLSRNNIAEVLRDLIRHLTGTKTVWRVIEQEFEKADEHYDFESLADAMRRIEVCAKRGKEVSLQPLEVPA